MKRLIILIFSLCLFVSLEGQSIIRANPFARAQVVAGGVNLLNGLVSYWTLDEASGGTSEDSHGSNDGTVTGATQGVAAKLSNGVLFNADLENITVPYNASLDITGTISFAFWIYYDGEPGGGNAILLKDYADSKMPYQVYTLSDYPRVRVRYDATWYSIASTRTLSAGWKHVVITVNATGNSTVFYIDGVAEAAQTGITQLPTNGAGIVMGYYATGSMYSYIRLDEVGIWNRILTQDDVDALYNGGSGLAYTSF
jgi:hypothetical protein